MGLSTTRARPAVSVVDFSDLTADNAEQEVIQQDGMTLQAMPLQARRVIVRLPSTVVLYHSTNLRVCTRTRVRDELLAYVTWGPRTSGTVNGIRIRPGIMVAAEPGIPADFIAEPNYEIATLLVPAQLIQMHAEARQFDGNLLRPRGVEILQADAARTRRLFRLAKRLVVLATASPELFEEGRPEREFAQVELLDTLFAATRAAVAAAPVGKDQTLRTHSQVVRVAEDYVLAQHQERVHVSALCRAADVSERTLEVAFREVTGLSPLAYLNRMRLHQVRAALLAAEPGSTQVSAEALKWGFWHFGDFARAYKRCFGESPSTTLHRTARGSGPGGNTVAIR